MSQASRSSREGCIHAVHAMHWMLQSYHPCDSAAAPVIGNRDGATLRLTRSAVCSLPAPAPPYPSLPFPSDCQRRECQLAPTRNRHRASFPPGPALECFGSSPACQCSVLLIGQVRLVPPGQIRVRNGSALADPGRVGRRGGCFLVLLLHACGCCGLYACCRCCCLLRSLLLPCACLPVFLLARLLLLLLAAFAAVAAFACLLLLVLSVQRLAGLGGAFRCRGRGEGEGEGGGVPGCGTAKHKG